MEAKAFSQEEAHAANAGGTIGLLAGFFSRNSLLFTREPHAHVIFLTGFPGFLGVRLVRRLASKHPEASFRLLVQPKFMDKAQHTLRALGLEERAGLMPGDLTLADLGLGERCDELAAEVTQAYHLAAVYDLSVPREVGWAVNVEGTRHVLNFLEGCEGLSFFGYVSTAYVSGRRTGLIKEDELKHEADFKNCYEETKYHAEVLVQERMDRLPTTIFRPSIVVGDSKTGATEKFDGPYFIINLLRRLPRFTLMTRIGSGYRPVNVVPVDYVTEAMTYLSNRSEHLGKVFHLTDPNPITAQEMLDLLVRFLDMRAIYVPIPADVARVLAATPLGSYLGLTPQIVDYFDFPAYYDSRRTQRALEGSGIACPPFEHYAPQLVDFVKAHARGEVRTEAMY